MEERKASIFSPKKQMILIAGFSLGYLCPD
jgi:hypothetical protein